MENDGPAAHDRHGLTVFRPRTKVDRRMSALLRCCRALALALLLPALLAPSGWAWHLCFCGAVEEAAGCCREVAPPSCCDPSERPADHDCGQCVALEAAHKGLPPATDAPSVDVPALAAAPAWTAPPTASLAATVRLRAERGPAPPGRVTPLPLRI
jgi:hypothetical protein